MGNEKKIKSTNKTNIEANVLNRLISHLQSRTDVQNIDLMNLSGFCRNCLSKWYVEEAAKLGIEVNKDKSREIIYGMPHKIWKKKYQKDASEEQLSKFDQQK